MLDRNHVLCVNDPSGASDKTERCPCVFLCLLYATAAGSRGQFEPLTRWTRHIQEGGQWARPPSSTLPVGQLIRAPLPAVRVPPALTQQAAWKPTRLCSDIGSNLSPSVQRCSDPGSDWRPVKDKRLPSFSLKAGSELKSLFLLPGAAFRKHALPVCEAALEGDSSKSCMNVSVFTTPLWAWSIPQQYSLYNFNGLALQCFSSSLAGNQTAYSLSCVVYNSFINRVLISAFMSLLMHESWCWYAMFLK